MLGPALEQLLILAGVGVGLMVLVVILRAVFRLTKVFLRLGCLGVLIVLGVAFLLMRGFAG
ncbi:MAG: hypothetical protein R6X31_09430 [Anaerolineae bacterium]|nr:hypothetical protein [Chloroflexota bacterium]